jgi:hypothetical protein
VWNSGRQSMDAPGLIPPLIGAPLSPRSGGVAGIVEDLLVDRGESPARLAPRTAARCRAAVHLRPAERMASRTGAVVVPFDEKALREAPVRLASPARCAREHAATLSRTTACACPPARRADCAAPPRSRPARAS